ncbi:tumor necrosis factor receptor superfamily member 19L-like [Arapaima gigas]
MNRGQRWQSLCGGVGGAGPRGKRRYKGWRRAQVQRTAASAPSLEEKPSSGAALGCPLHGGSVGCAGGRAANQHAVHDSLPRYLRVGNPKRAASVPGQDHWSRSAKEEGVPGGVAGQPVEWQRSLGSRSRPDGQEATVVTVDKISLKMMRNHLCCLVLLLLTQLGSGAGRVLCGQGKVLTSLGCVCLRCPRGQEPSRLCGGAEQPHVELRCQVCPAGSFSDSYGPEPCRPHRSCGALNRLPVKAGGADSNALCGDCVDGFWSPEGTSAASEACVKRVGPLVRVARNVGKNTPQGLVAANSTNTRSAEEKTTEYAVFALVPIFCIMGLLGILICNILKKKGYRCSAEKEAADDEGLAPHKDGNPGPYVVDDPNEDTISVLVRLITEKKENAAALEELLLEYESKQMSISKASSIKFPALSPLAQFRLLPRLCSHQRHLHTINGLALRSGSSCCSRCSQRKWPELLLPPADGLTRPVAPPAKTSAQGEVTILSVGRFQVAQIPEQKDSVLDLTPQEASDTDSMDSSHTEPAEEKSLLGTLSSSSSRTKSRAEVSC